MEFFFDIKSNIIVSFALFILLNSTSVHRTPSRMSDETEKNFWSETARKIHSDDHETRLAGLKTVKGHLCDRIRNSKINSIPSAILMEILQCIKNYIDDKTWYAKIILIFSDTF